MITYLLLRLCIVIFGYLPFCVLYRLSDLLVWIFYLSGVRKNTIADNLQLFFPELNKKSRNKLIRSVYRNFFDVMFVEMIKSFTISEAALTKRFNPGDLSALNPYIKNNQSLIMVLGHYANWEWGVNAVSAMNCVAFYKPLKNRYIDRYIRRTRSSRQFELASVKKPLSIFLKYRDRQTGFFLIADKQNVKKKHLKRVMWLPFLGVDSPFLLGPEKYAKSFDYPVFYSKITRVKRGYYQHELILVSDNPAQSQTGEITKKWVDVLEQQVKENPAGWFWLWAATQSRQQSFK